MSRAIRHGGLAASLLIASCTGDIGGTPEPVAPDLVSGTVGFEPVATGPIAIAPEAPVRQRRRMDLDQLQAALAQVTGSSGWSELGRLASTLGVPDFLETTEEDLSASPMFQKFLDDAARALCADLMTRELQAAPGDRIFIASVDPERPSGGQAAAVRADMAQALLRFHGRKLAPTDPAVAPWATLVNELDASGLAARETWKTVCVGLVTHPHFYTY